MAMLGWVAWLRCSEIVNLQLCDLTWHKGKSSSYTHVTVLVRKTKADQRGRTTTTEFAARQVTENRQEKIDAAEAKSRHCFVNHLHSYVSTVLGGELRHDHCTRDKQPGTRCPHCPWLFPRITVRGVETQAKTDARLLRLRLKAAMLLLEGDGVVEAGWASKTAVISLRRGGCSEAAGRGCREQVRVRHGRWGAAARKRLAATAEGEYNSTLPTERWQVSSALYSSLGDDCGQLG